ncbi:PREDICTED: nuclear RNA export factor 3-like [Chrysochloris asiatica]|uniref:Nuclear RNA export factor 3-like n=1 Tax=Chrysochloris asiatica TaxID=185453 RepID=A0A9B0X0X9_CHRAS|nr:PREDICTED: nuclear RNA export factor 3-like [Chrysochloris asiatica]
MLWAAGHIKENDYQGDSFKRRARCWCVSQRRYINCTESVGPGIHQSSHQEQYGDIAMRDGHMGAGVKYTLYAIPTYYQSDILHKGEQIHGNIEREQSSRGRIREQTGWDNQEVVKITIPRGVKYDELVPDLIQSKCNFSLSLYAPGAGVKKVKLVKVIKKASDSCQETLDLLRLHSDPGVMTQGKLDKVKGLELEERCADPSPDKPNNVSTLLELFPKVLCLDGQELPRPGICDAENNKKFPTCKESILGSETLQKLLMKFLTQCYWIYNYGDQQGLLGAYHNEACFSLTILFNPEDPHSSSLVKNATDSRDMEKCKGPDLMSHLLKHKT